MADEEQAERYALTPEQVRFEIRFALGQLGSSHFIAAHSKIPDTRLRAMDAITAAITERFKPLEVTAAKREVDGPLFGSARQTD